MKVYKNPTCKMKKSTKIRWAKQETQMKFSMVCGDDMGDEMPK